MNEPIPPLERMAYTVAEVMALTGFGEAKVLSLLQTKKLPAQKIGSQWSIGRLDLEGFLNPGINGVPTRHISVAPVSIRSVSIRSQTQA